MDGRPVSETIVAAAIQSVDGSKVWTQPAPARHHQVMLEAYEKGGASREDFRRQGFITSTGRFVDRIEAGKIALASGQCDRFKGNVLTSEDLW